MRIVAVSDTHRNTAQLQRSVRQAVEDGPIDVFIHCGDGVKDLDVVEDILRTANPNLRIYAVRGNCDLGAFNVPVSELADLNGVRAMITHGHIYDVKHGLGMLSKAARSLRASLVFFGHTHRPLVEQKHGVTLINPGSLAALALTDTAYLEVLIDSDSPIRENFIKLR